MKKEYIAPDVVALDLSDLTVMLGCSCSADDDNPHS